ncbi:MAG: transcriptional regulator [Nitrosomonadaceae bacterium]|jgi:predicted transcriptional regulator
MKLFEEISSPRELRRKLGLNQHDFWSKVGVTQSGGSRYESGRNMPRPVRELVRLVHIEQIDLTKIRKDDLIVAELLKIQDPELYKNLKKSIKSK